MYHFPCLLSEQDMASKPLSWKWEESIVARFLTIIFSQWVMIKMKETVVVLSVKDIFWDRYVSITFFLSRLNLDCSTNGALMIHEHRLPKVSNVSKNKYTVTSLHLNQYRNSLTHCSRQCCTKSTCKIYDTKDFLHIDLTQLVRSSCVRQF